MQKRFVKCRQINNSFFPITFRFIKNEISKSSTFCICTSGKFDYVSETSKIGLWLRYWSMYRSWDLVQRYLYRTEIPRTIYTYFVGYPVQKKGGGVLEFLFISLYLICAIIQYPVWLWLSNCIGWTLQHYFSICIRWSINN